MPRNRVPNIRTLPSRVKTLAPAIASRSPNSTRRATKWRDIQRRRRYLRKNPMCVHCQARGVVAAAIECDHIVPLHAGGVEAWANFQSLCRPCHIAKTNRDARGEFQTVRYPQRPESDGFAIA